MRWIIAIVAAILVVALVILALRFLPGLHGSSTASNSSTTQTARPTIPPPDTSLFPFEVNAPVGNCSGDVSQNNEQGKWGVVGILPSNVSCPNGDHAQIQIHTPPLGGHILGGIQFFGVLDKNNNPVFPATYQVIVYVDVTNLNFGCAGIGVHPNANGYPLVGYFICNNRDCQLHHSPGNGVWALVDLSSGKSISVINNTCHPIPEGEKGNYGLELHDSGSTIYVVQDSKVEGTITTPQPDPGATPYVGLAVFSDEATTGVDTVTFHDFSFAVPH